MESRVFINGRDSGGRFAGGNTYGKGRPKLETEREYLRAIKEACDQETWKEILLKAVEQAKQGEPKARTFLANYLIGRPNDEKYNLELSDRAASKRMEHEHSPDETEERIFEILGDSFSLRDGKFVYKRFAVPEDGFWELRRIDPEVLADSLTPSSIEGPKPDDSESA